MKTVTTFLMTLVLAIGVIFLFSGTASAQVCDGTGNQYQDHNGDGFNDDAADHDGDGIPNGQDPDWEAPEDGTGYQHKNLKGEAAQTMNKGEVKQVGKTDGEKSPGSEGSGNQYQNAIKTQNKGEAGEAFQNKQQLGFKAGEGDGEGQGEMSQTQTQTQPKTQAKIQNKGELKQQFQNKMQTFTRTQTMTQLHQRNQVCTGSGPAAGSGAGDGSGSGTGNGDGSGPKEPKRNGGNK